MEITVLEDRRIKVEPIMRKRAFFPEGHDGQHTYTGCHKDYGLPVDLKRRTYVNPFKDEQEQLQFEQLLDQKPGALNLYNLKSKFWGEFSLMLTKDGITLDLSSPVDALWYRVLKVNPRFANSEEYKADPKCDFVLVDERVKEEVKTDLAKKEEEAIDLFVSIKKSRQKMYDVLRLLNKKPDKDASIESLKATIQEIIKEPGSNKGVTNINDFIRVMEDPHQALKLFILDAIDINEIEYSNQGYRIKESGKFIGKYLEQAVDYFDSKDAEVKEAKAIISQRIKDNK